MKEMLKIVINNIVLIMISLVFFVLFTAFDTTFSYITKIEKERITDIDEKNISKTDKFLKEILMYKILNNLMFIMIYFAIITLINATFINNIYFYVLSVIIIIALQVVVKVISKINVYKTLLYVINYINILLVLLYPIIYIIKSMYIFINNILNNGRDIEERDYTEDDIRRMLNEASTKDVEVEEKEMIHSIFNFTDTTVKEIMTPRTSIIAFEREQKLEEVWDEILENEFSRVPIYNESIDDIIGILYTKDLLKYVGNGYKGIKLGTIVKNVAYVPETKSLTDMLEYFRKEQQHMAIIIDEYGGTLGLITIEDLLEEIVGEIRDEYDVEEENFKKLSNNVYEILGETLVEEINDELDLDIQLSEEYDTISGYINYKLDRVAEINDKVVEEKYIIQVLKIDNKRIQKVKIIIKE
ncbi:hemolysin family protein [Pseudostreptobacillus hongkongensis]|uniref:hemolysin family protein n=1 Tax=Pseudostreptobacillus hongkongensis TaxID=1162717 RepID=UPI0009ECB9CB|nr:hemolysin family protein [Pseudostreptobacillus hongkongensis]